MNNIEKIFTGIGGKFLTPYSEFEAKLKNIRAFIFDWDGVFNNGEKIEKGSSSFSEVDSMGTNLLRFSHWLQHQGLPFTAVISGERNSAAFWFCEREHFHGSYYKVANKIEALEHFCAQHQVKKEEVAYAFDDVLDLSIAKVAGIRILIGRKANPLFMQYAESQKYADYVTGCEAGNFPLREACELMMGVKGMYKETMDKRVAYDHIYRAYADDRNKVMTKFFTRTEKGIVEQDPRS
ncbi:MAG TPA: phosphatase [Bacteroidia bacterium]